MEITNAAPGSNTVDVRRDWSLTADVIDTTYGVDSGVAVKVNGSSVTVTETSITDGRRVEYIPGSPSGYGERVTIEITATPTGQSAETVSWRFTIATGQVSATSSPPPDVVVIRDIDLDAEDADETLDGVNIVWLEDITHPLIVTEDQAEAVGTVAVDGNTYHKHLRSIQVDRLDANSDSVAALQEGDLIAFTATARGETAQKAEVLAIRQTIDQDDDVIYQLLVQYYEAV